MESQVRERMPFTINVSFPAQVVVDKTDSRDCLVHPAFLAPKECATPMECPASQGHQASQDILAKGFAQ